MTSEKSPPEELARGAGKKPPTGGLAQPDWAKGLQRLYDSVVEEDLPDSFKDLLSQLDKQD